MILFAQEAQGALHGSCLSKLRESEANRRSIFLIWCYSYEELDTSLLDWNPCHEE